MTNETIFASVDVAVEERTDGTAIFSNRLHLPEETPLLSERLRHWAAIKPDAIFLSEPAPGGRRTISYFEIARSVDDAAARLLHLQVSTDRPLLIVGANGINHAILILAAAVIGVPAAVMSPSYSSASAAPWAKFGALLDEVDPAFVVADYPEQIASVLESLGRPLPAWPLRDLAWLEKVEPADAAALATVRAAVTPDTVTKLLFTSGSTGAPKAVKNTQRMMVSNMQGLELVWPFLNDNPPTLVDWLPWNHTFGGNCCFNLALYFGGTLHIDDGKPLPGAVEQTVRAITEGRPSVYFNVPSGYEALLTHLEHDLAFAKMFLGGVNFLFNAGALMPATVRTRLENVAERAIGRVPPIVGAWGATETAPFSTVIYQPSTPPGSIGVPLPGTQIKLVPTGGRTELRVRGPNVMPGYWRQPEATAAAFDDEGFYRIGDAGRFADPARPEAGLIFDGRVAENFKLSTGTWVNVAAVRLAVIAAAEGLVTDAVVAGEGRDDIGALLFMSEHGCRSLIGQERCRDLTGADLFAHPDVEARIAQLLDAYNAKQFGSSTRVARFAILHDTPDPLRDEITDKGYVNQRATLRNRAETVAALYAQPDESVCPSAHG